MKHANKPNGRGVFLLQFSPDACWPAEPDPCSCITPSFLFTAFMCAAFSSSSQLVVFRFPFAANDIEKHAVGFLLLNVADVLVGLSLRIKRPFDSQEIRGLSLSDLTWVISRSKLINKQMPVACFVREIQATPNLRNVCN
jgi:hypothetical protein